MDSRSLQESAIPLLLLHTTAIRLSRSCPELMLLLISLVICDNRVDCFIEDLVNTSHLFTTAFHITCSHLPSYGHSLLLSDRGQALGFEEVDACAFGSKIGLEANKEKRSVRAEMEDFRVPL